MDLTAPSASGGPGTPLRHLLLFPLLFALGPVATAQVTYTFSNNEVSTHDSWDSGNDWANALVKPVTVSGVPTTGMVLRQIEVDLGSASGSNITTLQARLTDPLGNFISVFQPGYFFDTPNSRFVNIKLRDHAALDRLDEYTNSFLGMPYSFGYYRVTDANSFATLNTTAAVNGTWTFSMIENTGTEIQFNAVTLVFGPPFNVVDISAGNVNAACAGARCLQSGAGEVVLATNIGYPQGQPNYPPLNIGGCAWNAEANNTAWFYFVPTTPTVQLSVSGLGNNVQQTVVLRNNGTCAAPAYVQVGCPLSMFVNDCNTVTGDPLLYHRVCYDGGTKFNHGYTLTGLTVGQEYLLLVDGQSASETELYVELTSGADDGCPLVVPPAIVDVTVEDLDCEGNGGTITITATGSGALLYSIDGGLTYQEEAVFEGVAPGVYTIVVQDGSGQTATAQATVSGPEIPVIDNVLVEAPSCGVDNGSITVVATGTGLQYSVDGGVVFQAGGTFAGLAAGVYTVVVVNADGCTATEEVSLSPGDAPVIDAITVTAPTCTGDVNGSFTIAATGQGTLTYSIDGGTTVQEQPFFGELAAGTYTVLVSDTAGCTTSTTVELTDPAPVVITLATVADETCFDNCDGTISVVADAAVSFTLNGNDPQATGTWEALCAGNYVVQALDANGCAADTTLVIEAGNVVLAGFSVDADAYAPGAVVTFTNSSTGAVQFAWDFDGFGTSAEVAPAFTYPEGVDSIQVCLTAVDAQGCFDEACLFLFQLGPGTFEVPNIFSPNGDGRNDIFAVIGDPGPLRSFSLEVFNRYGQLLFTTDRIRGAWDGRTFAGEPASEGTYFWVLRYTTEGGQGEERSGHLTLVR